MICPRVAMPLQLLQLPFVGRRREVELLLNYLHETGDGRGGSVLIAGEPGVGKTRLLEEFAGEAQQRAARILWGRCLDLYGGEGAPPYRPWIEVLRACING